MATARQLHEFSTIANGFMPGSLTGAVPERLCEKLAQGHYENFSVGSIFLPRPLRKHVFNIYAYCRVCDDMADETGDPQLSVRLLQWWREELFACFAGRPRHAVFLALRPTIEEFNLPMQPFDDLISAFLQDQRVKRYETYDQLLGYCERSANPVGRLLLCLMGYRDDARRKLSDMTCTALQLANFWQDIGSDYARGRVYIPQEDLLRFGYSEAELANSIVNASFRRLMRFEIDRARELFERGSTLGRLIEGDAATDVELFSQCGIAVLNAIERNNYDVLHRRIQISKSHKLFIALSWALRRFLHWSQP